MTAAAILDFVFQLYLGRQLTYMLQIWQAYRYHTRFVVAQHPILVKCKMAADAVLNFRILISGHVSVRR